MILRRELMGFSTSQVLCCRPTLGLRFRWPFSLWSHEFCDRIDMGNVEHDRGAVVPVLGQGDGRQFGQPVRGRSVPVSAGRQKVSALGEQVAMLTGNHLEPWVVSRSMFATRGVVAFFVLDSPTVAELFFEIDKFSHGILLPWSKVIEFNIEKLVCD